MIFPRKGNAAALLFKNYILVIISHISWLFLVVCVLAVRSRILQTTLWWLSARARRTAPERGHHNRMPCAHLSQLFLKHVLSYLSFALQGCRMCRSVEPGKYWWATTSRPKIIWWISFNPHFWCLHSRAHDLRSDFPALLHGHSPLIDCIKSTNSIKLFHHEGTCSVFEKHAERHHSDAESIELLWASMIYLYQEICIEMSQKCSSWTHLIVTCSFSAARRHNGQASMQMLDLDGKVAGREQWLQAVVSVQLVPVCWRPDGITWETRGHIWNYMELYGHMMTYANLRKLSISFSDGFMSFHLVSWLRVLQNHHRACDILSLGDALSGNGLWPKTRWNLLRLPFQHRQGEHQSIQKNWRLARRWQRHGRLFRSVLWVTWC